MKRKKADFHGAAAKKLHRPDVSVPRAGEDRWLSVDEIAAHLGIKRETVYPWITQKNMPAHKVGRLWKFKKDEVDDWVRTGEAGRKEQE